MGQGYPRQDFVNFSQSTMDMDNLQYISLKITWCNQDISQLDGLTSQQCSFSNVVCGNVIEVHESRSDIPVTKDNLKVTA